VFRAHKKLGDFFFLTHDSIFCFAITPIEVTIAQDYFTFYQVSRSQKYEISTPQEVKHVSTQTTRDHLRSLRSQRPATLNNNTSTSGWYTPDVAPSTLLWLAGPKDCLEDSIPELGRFNFQFCAVRKPMSKMDDQFNDD